MDLTNTTSRYSKPLIVTAGLVLVIFLGELDALTDPELSFSIFYLLPISLVTWYAGRTTGILLSTVSAAAWFVANYLSQGSYSHSLIPFWNMFVLLGFFLVMTFLLSALNRKLDREGTLARTDSLTQIPNRRRFYGVAESEIERASRYRHPFTVAMIDIDNFKFVNDRFGHHAGDALLCSVALTIHGLIRKVDTVARLGGDEFAILLSETGSKPAQEVFSRLQDRLSRAMRDKEWPVTFSVGVITFVHPPSSVDEMIKKADDLMYCVKQSGKNTIRHETFDTTDAAFPTVV